jgi:hypothetical protein
MVETFWICNRKIGNRKSEIFNEQRIGGDLKRIMVIARNLARNAGRGCAGGVGGIEIPQWVIGAQSVLDASGQLERVHIASRVMREACREFLILVSITR